TFGSKLLTLLVLVLLKRLDKKAIGSHFSTVLGIKKPARLHGHGCGLHSIGKRCFHSQLNHAKLLADGRFDKELDDKFVHKRPVKILVRISDPAIRLSHFGRSDDAENDSRPLTQYLMT